jgi:hypothetical protein
MEIELHVTVPGQGRAVLTGRGKDTFHMRFSVRGTAGATAWVKDLFKVPHSGYCPAMGGPWAGRIGGRLPILVMALVDKSTLGKCSVAFIKMPPEVEMPKPYEWDELVVPPFVLEQLAARRRTPRRHRRAAPRRPPKPAASHTRRP